jgi:hypothetical protein
LDKICERPGPVEVAERGEEVRGFAAADVGDGHVDGGLSCTLVGVGPGDVKASARRRRDRAGGLAAVAPVDSVYGGALGPVTTHSTPIADLDEVAHKRRMDRLRNG